jgi:hypothetical protein
MTDEPRTQVIHFPDGTEKVSAPGKLLEVTNEIDWNGKLAVVVKVEDDDDANERQVWVQ